jgi:glutamate N-acetyltransferase/amino-acid N-acetyltransferase
VVTDACVDRAFLRQALHQAVENSFNIITVDRDTSTNDMVLIMANGEAQSPEIVADTSAGREFAVLLREVLLDLAKMIVRDGEGATKLVHVKVDGAVDSSDARRVAYSVATSNLVKTAFFGEDANWGLRSAGRSR